MKKNLLILSLLLLILPFGLRAQCTTTNATGCACKTPGATNCDLLPDITVSEFGMWNEMGGPTEYPQVCNPPCNGNDGLLRITTSTPNIGRGPLTVGSVSIWICDGDTITTNPGASCPLTGSAPKQLVKQRIYHKDGTQMSYWERWAGGMTYHPTHGHMHVDEWIVLTLRTQDPTKPDPRDWPIVATGSKLGFCLMDYGSCSTYNGHCRDSANNILINSSFPNYGLGGGQYNCSPTLQGISSGYTDIYHENLDGMYIPLPPNLCNGTYWVVAEADKNDHFLEENENNNWLATPITLTQQLPAGNAQAAIDYNGATHLCAGETAVLGVNVLGATSYNWVTGDTTPTITVNQSGDYYVQVNSVCGVAHTDTVHIDVEPNVGPVSSDVNLCGSGTATLTATGTGTINWYNSPTSTTPIATGSSYTTPNLSSTTQYYVSTEQIFPGPSYHGGPVDNTFGSGANHTNNTRYQIFTVNQACTLESVKVFAQTAGNRTVALMSSSGALLDSVVVNIAAGTQVVNLNMPLQPGTDYRLGLTSTSASDLYRNNSGVVYPYNADNLLSITGSSAGADYFYYYYDWVVKGQDKLCVSPQTTVNVNVNTIPTPTIVGLAAMYNTASPNVTLVGNPAGGTFSGTGVSGNVFSPATAGVGTYSITYNYTSPQGCSGSVSQEVTVTQFIGIDNMDALTNLELFPNPTSKTFRLSFELMQNLPLDIAVVNLAGQKVWETTYSDFVGKFSQEIDLEKFASGVYFVEIRMKDAFMRTKVVKE